MSNYDKSSQKLLTLQFFVLMVAAHVDCTFLVTGYLLPIMFPLEASYSSPKTRICVYLWYIYNMWGKIVKEQGFSHLLQMWKKINMKQSQICQKWSNHKIMTRAFDENNSVKVWLNSLRKLRVGHGDIVLSSNPFPVNNYKYNKSCR
jgi:hypothetical protein